MAATRPVKVSVVTQPDPIEIDCSEKCTAEDLCISLCKRCQIPPLTRTLFALRIRGTNLFLNDNSYVLSSTRDYELRIRYKVPRYEELQTLDDKTFDYYYLQARNDVNNNAVPEIKYSNHKDELLGLGIMDMARVVLEDKLDVKDVINNYKKYVAKEVVRKHGVFVKKRAHDPLRSLCVSGHKYNITTLKSCYLQELYTLAPNYLAEEYDNVTWKNNENGKNKQVPVRLVVAPFDPQTPGIKMYNKQEREWRHVCTIDELIYFTRNGDNTLEVSRRGTPYFFKFVDDEQLSSFISVCDGCYRLMVKWTFNLSKDDETPSLKMLQSIRCHGPIGGAFSFRKLEEKREKKHGCYILRQCQDAYNVYYLDVCTKSRTTGTHKIEFRGHCWLLNNVEYSSIQEMVQAHKKPDENIYLEECIPPSEYDKSQLLLCGEPQKTGVRVADAELQEVLKDHRSPRCLPTKDILLYTGSDKVSSENITVTYKALWKLDETKKLVVAYKSLQKDKMNDYLKDFIVCASKWSCIQSSSIVRLYGITLSSPTALVLEYLPYGPFDAYLKENASTVNVQLLLRASASLARALWDLSEAGIVHGHLRCRRLLLAAVDDDRVVVKLAGPSLRRYRESDIHWTPVELYGDPDAARRSVLGDIWAFATTVWEIYSLGQSPADMNPALTRRSYEKGDRLPWPKLCPAGVWALLAECWAGESSVMRPQAIMRDMNRMLHTDPLYDDSRHYTPVIPSLNISADSIEPGATSSLGDEYPSSLRSLNPSINSAQSPCRDDDNLLDDMSISSIRSRWEPEPDPPGGAGPLPPGDAPSLMESIVSNGHTYLVTKEIRIGGGMYGDVYRGRMETDSNNTVYRTVAIKTLKDSCQLAYKDYRNELDIMKSLRHPNVVDVLGFSDCGYDHQIVMEYMEEGSLYNYLHRHRPDLLEITNLLKYALDIASGMDYISSKQIVHRDLAARNILVQSRNRVKISDFGLARALSRDQSDYTLRTSRKLPFNWYAPESVVDPFKFSTHSDVWSYGVTVWEIFTFAKDVPVFDPKKQDPTTRASQFPQPEKCPNKIFDKLMRNCWQLKPENRTSFEALSRESSALLADYISARRNH